MKLNTVGEVIAELDRNEVTLLLEMADGVDLKPVRATLLQRRGDCELPEGTVLLFHHPASNPDGVACPALLRALRPFVAAAAIGLQDGRKGAFHISCPGEKGTLWQVSAV